MMKIYLDDVRDVTTQFISEAEYGWVSVRTYADFITIVKGCWDSISTISMDHDLGEHKTGYDALCVIEELAHEKGTLPFDILVHSANPVGVAKMFLTIRRLRKKYPLTNA